MLEASTFTPAGTPAFPWAELDAPHRMALVIGRALDLAGEDATVSENDFLQAIETCDLTPDELRRHLGDAQRIVLAPAPDPVITRAERVARGAALVLGLMPAAGDVLAVLRHNGFSTREVGELWTDIVDRGARSFSLDRAPRAEHVPPMPDWGRDMLAQNAE